MLFRSWAAKGPLLLGIKAVLAESFERIHRSNLVGMGILPLEYLPGENLQILGLSGREIFHILGLAADLKPHMQLTIRAENDDGNAREFRVIARLDSPIEVEYYLMAASCTSGCAAWFKPIRRIASQFIPGCYL